MEQEKIDVMRALTMWRHVINRVAIVFGVGRNNIYANFRVLVFKFWKITQLYREGNALEIEGSFVIDVTGHALDVAGLRRIQRRQNGPFEAVIIAVLHVNHCMLLGDIRGCRDVTETCKWAKFGDNKSKLKNEVKHEAAASRIKLFDASKKVAQKLSCQTRAQQTPSVDATKNARPPTARHPVCHERNVPTIGQKLERNWKKQHRRKPVEYSSFKFKKI